MSIRLMNSNASIIPFQVEHLETFKMRAIERELLAKDSRRVERFNILAKESLAGTIFYKDLALAIIGYLELWPGVLELWAFPSEYVTEHPLIYLRMARRYVKLIERTHNVHRLQTSSRAHPIEDRWMEFLGFSPEGTLRMFTTDKQDYRMWAKLIERPE